MAMILPAEEQINFSELSEDEKQEAKYCGAQPQYLQPVTFAAFGRGNQ